MSNHQLIDKSNEKPQKTKYQVKVIREKCISAGSCEAIAPQTYVLDDKNLAVVIDQDGNSDEEKLMGAQSCPVAAIEVFDTETGNKIWPEE